MRAVPYGVESRSWGITNKMQRLAFIPGSNLVGTVHSLGAATVAHSTFRVGDKVAAAMPGAGTPRTPASRTPASHTLASSGFPPATDPVVALCLLSAYVPA